MWTYRQSISCQFLSLWSRNPSFSSPQWFSAFLQIQSRPHTRNRFFGTVCTPRSPHFPPLSRVQFTLPEDDPFSPFCFLLRFVSSQGVWLLRVCFLCGCRGQRMNRRPCHSLPLCTRTPFGFIRSFFGGFYWAILIISFMCSLLLLGLNVMLLSKFKTY